MAQVTDRTVGANPTGFDMRTELNNIISALESDNSGSSEPLNTVAGMKWMDTSNATYYYVKERNHDNTAWVTLFRYTVATKVMEAVSNGVILQDSALVHKTGDETISGVKTFGSNTVFNGNVGIGSVNVTGHKLDIFGPSAAAPTSTSNRLSLRDLGGVSSLNFTTANEAGNLVERVYSSTSLALGTGATERLRIDASGNVLVTGSGGLGYGTGSGGTVTQLTSKSTAVTLNKPSGKITMHNASLASGAAVSFPFNNSLLANTDSIFLFSTTDAISANSYKYEVKYVGNGYCLISITNTSGASLSDNPIFSFTIIKGATA